MRLDKALQRPIKRKEKIEALVDKNGDDFMNPTVAEKQDKYQSRRKRHA